MYASNHSKFRGIPLHSNEFRINIRPSQKNCEIIDILGERPTLRWIKEKEAEKSIDPRNIWPGSLPVRFVSEFLKHRPCDPKSGGRRASTPVGPTRGPSSGVLLPVPPDERQPPQQQVDCHPHEHRHRVRRPRVHVVEPHEARACGERCEGL